ncbi:MAG: hypothetical protein M3Q07_10810 [Pseudobdellovibrionaceae bacterium]|nr:hypothetical protein [Pseudobdellovibrionaceae bacterium]
MHSALFDGAVAGLVATVPMTGAMKMMQHLPSLQTQALPPEKVARGVAQKLEVDQDMNRTEKAAFTWLSHFSFGAGAGTLYPFVVPSPQQHGILKGMLFGLAVWTVSYSGWIPAAGILRFPTRESKPYVGLEIASHLVWGAVLGAMAARMRRGTL